MPDLLITNAGRQAAIDADNLGMTVRMARIAVGTGQYVPVATQTTLQNQVAVQDIARGLAIGTDTLQVSARFTAGVWDAYELGLFLSDDTLFAVGSSSTPGDFPTKEGGVDVVVTATLLISDVPSDSVRVLASVEAAVPHATTLERDIVELADEMDPDTDGERAVTLELLKTKTDAVVTRIVGAAPALLDTLVEIATTLQDNPDVIADLLAAIALRARLDGAVFSGRTRGLTRPDNDDGQDFATTEWVNDNTDKVLTVIDDLARLATQTATTTATELLAAYPALTASQMATALLAAYPALTASQMATALLAAYPALTASQMATALLAVYPALTASQMATALLAVYPALTASQMATALLAAYPALTASQMATALLASGYGVLFSPNVPTEAQVATADFDDSLNPTYVGIRYYGDGNQSSMSVGPNAIGYAISDLPVTFNPDGGFESPATSMVSYISGTVTINISDDRGPANYYWIDAIVVW